MAMFHNSDDARRRMLSAIGAASIDDLFRSIPRDLFFKKLPGVDGPLSEMEVRHLFQRLSDSCRPSQGLSFLGAGAYDHYIPQVVDYLSGRGEFYTAYTPYQPEIAQGTLQAGYEFQSAICLLTGLDVANASLYDGSTALAEAVLMAERVTKNRHKVLLAASIHPEYLRVVETYLVGSGLTMELIPGAADGRLDLQALSAKLDETVAGVAVASPNFYGCIEDVAAVASLAKARGAIAIQATLEPHALAYLQTPAACGVDLFCGEGQGLGSPVSFGGPSLGLFAGREEFVRQMPGRLIGKTTDSEGRRAYCLTLSTREQHIRREKATSNICTNEALIALRALIYLTALGRSGLIEVARQNVDKAHYLQQELCKQKGVSLRYRAPFFNEFTLRLPKPASAVLKKMEGKNLLGGVPLNRFGAGQEDCLLVCVTEKHGPADLDRYLDLFKEALR